MNNTREFLEGNSKSRICQLSQQPDGYFQAFIGFKVDYNEKAVYGDMQVVELKSFKTYNGALKYGSKWING